jgi:hypothetical protein
MGTGGTNGWAPLVVGFPILVAGTGASVFVLARAVRPPVTARWIFPVAWAAVVGAAADS